MRKYPGDPCICGHIRKQHDGQSGCFADLPRNDDGTLDICPCVAFDLDAWAEVTDWARAGIAERDMLPDEEVDALIAKAKEQIRTADRARLAAILRTHYDEDADRVTFGDFQSCSDNCPGIVMDHVLKLLDAPDA